MAADSCHGRATISIGTRIDAREGRARMRNDPEPPVFILDNPAEFLTTFDIANAQNDRLGSHRNNACIHVHLQRLLTT